MLGFLCLGAMLAFSGMISMFQLGKLSNNTQNLLNSTLENMAVSKRMLDAAQMQNTSLLHIIVLRHNELDETFTSARAELEAALTDASVMTSNSTSLDSIYRARDNYYRLIDDFFMKPGEKDVEWFMSMYGSSYLTLTNAIKDYMVESQRTMLSEAEALEKYAYMAIMPGVLTLCVALLIVIIFAFMIDIYYIKPIQRMTRGLDAMLKHKFPYNVEVDGDDEIARLNGQLKELAALARDKIKE